MIIFNNMGAGLANGSTQRFSLDSGVTTRGPGKNKFSPETV